MNAFAASLIRTIVPVAAGAVISWLALINLDIDAEGQQALGALLTAALTGAYYIVVRLIETKVPQAGWLLGLAKSPDSYSNDATIPGELMQEDLGIPGARPAGDPAKHRASNWKCPTPSPRSGALPAFKSVQVRRCPAWLRPIRHHPTERSQSYTAAPGGGNPRSLPERTLRPCAFPGRQRRRCKGSGMEELLRPPHCHDDCQSCNEWVPAHAVRRISREDSTWQDP